MEYEFKIDMTCGGCKNAVERILNKMQKFKSVEATWEDKKLIVVSDEGGQENEIIEALSKWSNANNKTVEFVGVTQK